MAESEDIQPLVCDNGTGMVKRKKLYEQEIEKLGNFQLRVHDQCPCQLSYLIGDIRIEATIVRRRNDVVRVDFERLPGELPDVQEESEGGDGVERVGLGVWDRFHVLDDGAHEAVVGDDDPLRFRRQVAQEPRDGSLKAGGSLEYRLKVGVEVRGGDGVRISWACIELEVVKMDQGGGFWIVGGGLSLGLAVVGGCTA